MHSKVPGPDPVTAMWCRAERWLGVWSVCPMTSCCFLVRSSILKAVSYKCRQGSYDKCLERHVYWNSMELLPRPSNKCQRQSSLSLSFVQGNVLQLFDRHAILIYQNSVFSLTTQYIVIYLNFCIICTTHLQTWNYF